jgi:type II secretory pathway component PulJ
MLRPFPSGEKGFAMKKKPFPPFLPEQEGFTLLENVIALGLLSLVLLLSTETLLVIMKTNAVSQNRTGALALAQEKMESLKSQPVSDLRGESEGQVTNGNLPLVYQRETTIDRGGPSGCALVTVTVSWRSDPGESPHRVELATLIAE